MKSLLVLGSSFWISFLFSSFIFASTLPERIVSLDSTTTEILFALGVGERLVGRDMASYYPIEAQKISSIGYKYRLNSEGILSLNPDLILGQDDVKPETVLQQVSSYGIPLDLVSDINSCEKSQHYISKLGDLMQKQTEASQLISKMKGHLDQLESAQKQLQQENQYTPQKVLMLYVRGQKTQFIMGKGTGASEMIQIAGAKNVAESIYGTKPITSEALAAMNPDIVIFFKKGIESIGGVKSISQLPGMTFTQAGKNERFIIMDDLYLANYGPRCGAAAYDLFKAIYQQEGTVIIESAS